jgi:hypothetical protein
MSSRPSVTGTANDLPTTVRQLERLGVAFKNSRPYHPQTCGKVERLHQTLKRYLAKQAAPGTLQELQGQLDSFVHYYNDIRPHRALSGRTPLQAYSARVKARPAGSSPATYFRVRQDRVDQTGKVSLRYDSHLYKIGIYHKMHLVEQLSNPPNQWAMELLEAFPRGIPRRSAPETVPSPTKRLGNGVVQRAVCRALAHRGPLSLAEIRLAESSRL